MRASRTAPHGAATGTRLIVRRRRRLLPHRLRRLSFRTHLTPAGPSGRSSRRVLGRNPRVRSCPAARPRTRRRRRPPAAWRRAAHSPDHLLTPRRVAEVGAAAENAGFTLLTLEDGALPPAAAPDAVGRIGAVERAAFLAASTSVVGIAP